MEPRHLAPAIGAIYRNERTTVGVRAVSSSHVVCDGERCYSRDEFYRLFQRNRRAPVESTTL